MKQHSGTGLACHRAPAARRARRVGQAGAGDDERGGRGEQAVLERHVIHHAQLVQQRRLLLRAPARRPASAPMSSMLSHHETGNTRRQPRSTPRQYLLAAATQIKQLE